MRAIPTGKKILLPGNKGRSDASVPGQASRLTPIRRLVTHVAQVDPCSARLCGLNMIYLIVTSHDSRARDVPLGAIML
jgi:hypothetical protein